MKSLPPNDDLLALAPRIIWFERAEQALSNPVRFLAYLMTYGTLQDIIVVRRYLDLNDFREALEHAPPGIIDRRSWAYWNTVIRALSRAADAAAGSSGLKYRVARSDTLDRECRARPALSLRSSGYAYFKSIEVAPLLVIVG